MRMVTFFIDVSDGLDHLALPAERNRHRFWIFTEGLCGVRETALATTADGIILSASYPPQEFRTNDVVHVKSTAAAGSGGAAMFVRFMVEYY